MFFEYTRLLDAEFQNGLDAESPDQGQAIAAALEIPERALAFALRGFFLLSYSSFNAEQNHQNPLIVSTVTSLKLSHCCDFNAKSVIASA